MSQLVKLLRGAGRVTGRPTAGFGARQEGRQRLFLVAALDGPDTAAAKKAVEAGADVLELPLTDAKSADRLKDLAKAVEAPVGVALTGALAPDFDFAKLEAAGADYVKVEAGDAPATVFLLETAAVVLEVKESFSDTMLKMLNFLPAKAVQVDAPEDLQGLTIKRLMEARVDRELIGKPLLLRVGATIKPEAAQLLALISPNGLVVPAANVAAWKQAVADLKEPSETDDGGANISLRAPSAA
ncbi:MAG TPA: hypothetical protein VK457_00335 [Chloroflexota bacterium]|nr:hypothetical protein [Chloroflexota bacterium]